VPLVKYCHAPAHRQQQLAIQAQLLVRHQQDAAVASFQRSSKDACRRGDVIYTSTPLVTGTGAHWQAATRGYKMLIGFSTLTCRTATYVEMSQQLSSRRMPSTSPVAQQLQRLPFLSGRGVPYGHRPLSCSSITRSGGYHVRSSPIHCRSTVAGATTRLGRHKPLWCRPARYAMTWKCSKMTNSAVHVTYDQVIACWCCAEECCGAGLPGAR
jgi:hypothetical protein